MIFSRNSLCLHDTDNLSLSDCLILCPKDRKVIPIFVKGEFLQKIRRYQFLSIAIVRIPETKECKNTNDGNFIQRNN